MIAIIGILIALLLPAVQAARESARRAQCSSNFHQVGTALHNFNAAKKSFPPGMIMWLFNAGAGCGKVPKGSPTQFYGLGWGAYILPYIEENAVFQQFDFSQSLSGTLNQNFIASGAVIKTYLCPSDPNTGTLVNYSGGAQQPGSSDPREDLRESNMAGVSDTVDWTCDTLWPKTLANCNGMFGNRTGCRIKDVLDGTSHTLMIGEVTNDLPENYSGFYWATFGFIDTKDGINGPFTLPGGIYAANTSGGIYGLRSSGASSWHRGGCNFTMGDGSVRFISESISAQVLSALTTRAGGDSIDGGGY